ncbi:hypothetical protein KI387_037020 [Taxus chinensis]|uniref:Uncharacterized protein n=1 Tax=Taxus chinensis TaxID=29808 RepID=A0AA38KUQ0_TAXCH|nr:hypothetical protein KI387_037020 [Taxus chinensis]
MASSKKHYYETIVPAHLYSSSSAKVGNLVMATSPSEQNKIAMFSPTYYGACAIGGLLSCGPTHTAVIPLDVIKCNTQAVRKMGIVDLSIRGLPFRILMVGTLTGAQ